jgi:hypothetical protein
MQPQTVETQMFETGCGGHPNPPREQKSEAAARAYAAECTNRKVCDVAVIIDGIPRAMYRDGVDITASIAAN